MNRASGPARLLLAGLIVFSFTGCSSAEQTQVENKKPSAPGHEDMVEIPGGEFLYGATESQVDFFIYQSTFNYGGMIEKIRQQFVRPQRPEYLEQYSIDRFEVTNREFKEFLEATGYVPEVGSGFLKHWTGGSYPDWSADFPVVWVSARDAQSYCEWRGGSLPSELQWEKAARGADGRYFPWGNESPDFETANFGTEAAEPAGNRPGDESPYHVYDMGANVAELTRGEGNGPSVVIRGGSFRTNLRESMTTWRDLSANPHTRREDVGFRCVADR